MKLRDANRSAITYVCLMHSPRLFSFIFSVTWMKMNIDTSQRKSMSFAVSPPEFRLIQHKRFSSMSFDFTLEFHLICSVCRYVMMFTAENSITCNQTYDDSPVFLQLCEHINNRVRSFIEWLVARLQSSRNCKTSTEHRSNSIQIEWICTHAHRNRFIMNIE